MKAGEFVKGPWKTYSDFVFDYSGILAAKNLAVLAVVCPQCGAQVKIEHYIEEISNELQCAGWCNQCHRAVKK